MEFYSLVLRKKIKIKDENIRYVVKKGRRFAVGKYMATPKSGIKKEYEAWRILGAEKKK